MARNTTIIHEASHPQTAHVASANRVVHASSEFRMVLPYTDLLVQMLDTRQLSAHRRESAVP